MVRGFAWAAGLVAVMSLRTFAEPAPTAPTAPKPDNYEQRLSAMEQEMEELKLATAEGTAKSKAPGTFRAFWDKGLKFETEDKNFTLGIGGRLHWDLGFIRQDDDHKTAFGDLQDGTEFRRVRLEVEGTVYQCTYFKVQIDFGGSAVTFKDVYAGVKGMPLLGSLQAGHFKEPFSIEELTSSKYDTFLEQALPTEAFAPARNAGIAFQNSVLNERVTYALGVFRETDDVNILSGDDGYAVTGRVTACPWYADDGKKVLHLGVAMSRREFATDTVRYRSRPEWHQSSARFVDTKDIKHVESAGLLGLEGALVVGPFSAQAEYMKSSVSRKAGHEDAAFDGWYVQGSYWLTGESRKYDPKKGEFGRTSPNKNFGLGKDSGWGAIELAARYSNLDLNDAGAAIAGGVEKDFTLGLNWYLNPNMKVMFNWVKASTDQPDKGGADMLLVRVAADF